MKGDNILDTFKSALSPFLPPAILFLLATVESFADLLSKFCSIPYRTNASQPQSSLPFPYSQYGGSQLSEPEEAEGEEGLVWWLVGGAGGGAATLFFFSSFLVGGRRCQSSILVW